MLTNTTKAVSVKLNQTTRDGLEHLAQARQRTAHWLMREAIEQYVEREEKRAAYRQAGLAAWSAYQTTGQSVTQVSADAWLAKLEAGEDVEPPECGV